MDFNKSLEPQEKSVRTDLDKQIAPLKKTYSR